jgi:hypothetical protein
MYIMILVGEVGINSGGQVDLFTLLRRSRGLVFIALVQVSKATERRKSKLSADFEQE